MQARERIWSESTATNVYVLCTIKHRDKPKEVGVGTGDQKTSSFSLHALLKDNGLSHTVYRGVLPPIFRA